MTMNRIEFNVITGEQTTIPLTTEEIAELQSRPVPPPPPSYTAFWDALLASTVYGSIREQSMTSLPMNTLTTEFIALIGDAKIGRPSVARIQASMAAILTTGTFTAAHVADIGAALAAGNLADTFSIGAPDP
jgi:hypothetical protein